MNRSEIITWLKHQFRIHYELKCIESHFKLFLEYSEHYKLNVTLYELLN